MADMTDLVSNCTEIADFIAEELSGVREPNTGLVATCGDCFESAVNGQTAAAFDMKLVDPAEYVAAEFTVYVIRKAEGA